MSISVASLDEVAELLRAIKAEHIEIFCAASECYAELAFALEGACRLGTLH